MRLTRLDVESLPGISGAFTVRPEPGINIVVGPNTSGKSSLVRAVRSLLWPESTPQAADHLLSLSFTAGYTTQTASRRPNTPVAWTRDGQPCAPPRLPTDHLKDRYELGLLDLASRAGSERDHAFAAEIRRQTAGGFDLDFSGADLHPHSRGQATRKFNEWQSTRAACERFEQEHRSLARRDQQLESLRDELLRFQAARLESEALQAARAVHSARDGLDAAEHALSQFPAGLAFFQDDDPQTLRSLLAELKAAVDEAAADRDKLDRLEQELAALGAPPGDAGFTLDGLEQCVQMWREAESALARAAVNLAGALRQRDAAAAALGGAHLDGGRTPPSREDIAELARLYVDAAGAKARSEAADALLRERALSPADHLAEDHADAAIRAIDDWLASATPPLWPPVLCAVAGAVLLAVTQTAGSPAGIAGVAAIATALTLAFGGVIFLTRAIAGRRRASLRGREARQALAPLAATHASFTTRPEALQLRDRILAARTRTQLADDLRTRLADVGNAAREQVAQFEGTAGKLRNACGLGSALDARGVLYDVDAAVRLFDAEARLIGVAAEHEVLDRAHAQRADGARAALEAAGCGPLPDASEATSALLRLRRQHESRTRLAAAVGDIHERADTTARRRRNIEESLARLRGRLSLDPGGKDDDNVAVLASRWPERQRAVGARDQARAVTDARRDAADPALAALERGVLDARIAQSGAAPERERELQREIVELESDLARARTSRAFEEALFEKERARDRLADERTEARRAALVDWLLDEVREHDVAAIRPAVLEGASDLFRRFTHGGYGLVVHGAAGAEATFAAIDTTTTRPLALSELSDGTRMQLLLAVRLAFIMALEGDLRLPLFLDEALTTSDQGRFAAVAGALGELCRDQDRQIFYLTSQPADVGAWRQALAAKSLPAPCVIDLAEVRRLAGAATVEQLTAPMPAALPKPGAGGLEAYRLELGVPPFDPRLEAGHQHLDWLLLDDADLLWRLIGAGVSRVGPLLAERGDLMAGTILSAEQAARIAWRAAALASFIDHWRLGRGRPVTAADVIASNAVSESMRGPVLDLLGNLDGDAASFAARLHEVPRLQKKVAERLLDHLRDEGILDDEHEILECDTVLTRTLGDLGRRAAAKDDAHPDPFEVRACVLRWWQAAQWAAPAAG